MKKIRTKLVMAIGTVGVGLMLFSFDDANEPKFKQYEVIRSKDGVIQTYDTIIDVNSTFTPQQYLDLLGFSNDEKIEIIDMPSHDPQMMFFHGSENNYTPCDSMKFIEVEIDNNEMGDAQEGQQMIIEKKVIRKNIDGQEQEIVEIENFVGPAEIEGMVIGDSVKIMHEIVINEGEELPDNFNWTEAGTPDFERHINDGNMKMDLMIFGKGDDFTLLIVSNPSSVSNNKSALNVQQNDAANSQLKVFPNPSSKEVAIQLHFDDKAKTTITVSDNLGKTVLELDLGNFSGDFKHTLDVSKWAKGIYFVNVSRPNTKLVEKLVVE